MPWTQLDDVRRRYNRPLSPSQQTWVEALITDAEDELVELVPGLVERIEAQTLPLVRVQRVVAAAVIRVLRNPDGYVQHTRTTGPFSESTTRAATDTAGALTFTSDELDKLRPEPPKAAGTIALSIPAWRVP